MDRWKHRRRLVYVTVAFAVLMVIVGGLDWSDRVVSSQLVVGGVSLITLVLSGYVFAATYDDKWSGYGHSDKSPQDSGAYGDGVDC